MRTIFSMLVLGVALSATFAHAATTRGIVEAVDPSQITVSSHRYKIEPETELLDRGGQRIALKELIPGTPVELEIDDEGTLVALKATLIR